jgi:hypothetical protein
MFFRYQPLCAASFLGGHGRRSERLAKGILRLKGCDPTICVIFDVMISAEKLELVGNMYAVRARISHHCREQARQSCLL